MVKLEKEQDVKKIKAMVSYGRLMVLKLDDQYALALTFRHYVDNKLYLPYFYILEFFKSKDEVLPYIMSGKIDALCSNKNLAELPCIAGLAGSYACWVVKNYKLSKEKLKCWEIKSQLAGWTPYYE